MVGYRINATQSGREIARMKAVMMRRRREEGEEEEGTSSRFKADHV